jgi:glycosyltransferase involved in cell wall biosynthesis
MAPLVTVITPTLARRLPKLLAAVESVDGQTFTAWRHLIIPDGPPDDLLWHRDLFSDARRAPAFLGAHHETPGHWNRLLGGLLATTPYIAYLDDDNTWRPRHLEVAVKALEDNPDFGFSYSLMVGHPTGLLGHTAVRPGVCVNHIDASMIVHRRELLSEVATWDPFMAPPGLRYALDGFLVERWLMAGVRYAQIPEVTVNYSGVGYWLDGGGAPPLAPNSLGEVQ